MAKKFKDYYNKKTATLIGEKIILVKKDFDVESFAKYISKKVTGKEFLERQDVFVDAFEKFLGSNYTKNIQLFTKILGQELQTEAGMFTHGYWLWPIGRYVEKHGTKDFAISIPFIKELTKRFTGEFAIRPLLEVYSKKTVSEILKWSKDENVHVRRLASEGMRIHLPWTKKSIVCVENFSSYKKILTNLKNDESKFVQKSVGNNINDLYKSYPDKAEEIVSEWKNDSPSKATEWIIKHGRRNQK